MAFPTWVQVELPRITLINRVEWSSDRIGGFRGRFARPQPEEYRIEVSMDGTSWNVVADSEGRLPYSEEARELLLLHGVFTAEERRAWDDYRERKQSAEKELQRLARPQAAFLGQFKEPDEPSFVMVRGNPMSKGDEVAPASLSTLEHLVEPYELEADAPESERRLALARWIASDDNCAHGAGHRQPRVDVPLREAVGPEPERLRNQRRRTEPSPAPGMAGPQAREHPRMEAQASAQGHRPVRRVPPVGALPCGCGPD